jgi:hypothetical protein
MRNAADGRSRRRALDPTITASYGRPVIIG